MNQTGRDQRLRRQTARRRQSVLGEVGVRRTVAVAAQSMLAFAALLGGPTPAQTVAEPVAFPALATASVPALKREYLRCDRVSSQHRLTLEAGAYCSAVSGELLKREFEDDLDLLLAWWRAARQGPTTQ